MKNSHWFKHIHYPLPAWQVLVSAVLAATVVFGGSLFLWQEEVGQRFSLNSDNLGAPLYVAQHQPTVEPTVQVDAVAAKLDLERKIIAPENARAATEIKRVVEAAGGTVKTEKGGVLVAEIPKELESEIQEELAASGTQVTIEVDYPVFLTSEEDWGVVRIEAPAAWEKVGGSGVRVGVVDTGIDMSHPELSGRYRGGYDFVNSDSDPIDDHGHGTHVAGVIAAELNGSGVAGVSHLADVYGLKVLGADGSGYVSDIVAALDWAMANDLQVVNLSLGTTYDSSILRQKVQEAASSGVVLVAAAGNTSGGAVMYPAAYSQVISVAATDGSDNLASFSSLGAEVAAPGVAIKSTVPGGGYATWSGTSMAAPHVAATVALMLNNGVTDVRQQLRETALDLGPAGVDPYFGYGLIHTKPAVLGQDVLAPIVTFVSPTHESLLKDAQPLVLAVQDENEVATVSVKLADRVIHQWTAEPYEFLWDTTALADGEYELVAQAYDDSGNLGEAKVRVFKGEEPEPSPSPEVSAYPGFNAGQSGQYRQDQNTPAQEHRQNIYQQLPEQAQQKQSEPPVSTNAQQRNQRPAEVKSESTNQGQSNAQEKSGGNAGGSSQSQGKGQGNVKGASTSWWWQWLQQVITR